MPGEGAGTQPGAHLSGGDCPCACSWPYSTAVACPDLAVGDEDLMLLYCSGDAGAFDALYERHKGGLYRYLLRHCGNRPLAEELFQDVWMNLIRARQSYTVQAKFATYLYRLAHNRLVDHYRATAGRALLSFEDDDCPPLESIVDDRHPDAADALAGKRDAARLLGLIAELPQPQREAFLLQQEAEMTVQEIAEAIGVSRETAKSRLRYAIAKLRAGMRELV
jgi:RNA polymerase sigma-70 factor, ECF subfamily